MKKILVLMMVLCLVGTVSAKTITITGTIGPDLDLNANTWNVEVTYSMDTGTCAGIDLIIATPAGMANHDDVLPIPAYLGGPGVDYQANYLGFVGGGGPPMTAKATSVMSGWLSRSLILMA